MGSYGEVYKANDQALVKKYKKFINMNASIRGPFMPAWSDQCWTDVFATSVTDKVKVSHFIATEIVLKRSLCDSTTMRDYR